MNRRRFKEPINRLPKEYIEVEYLESTGTQYLSTDITNATNRSYLKVNVKYIYEGTYTGRLYGITDANANQSYFLGRYNNFAYNKGGDYIVLTDYVKNGINDYSATFNNGNILLKINEGQQTATATYRTLSKGLFGIFCRYRVDVSTYAELESIKLCKFEAFSSETNCILNLIPCKRKSDNKPGMYDIVNNKFYTNQGTGEFLTGPEFDCDATGELGPENPMKAKFVGYKKIDDTDDENIKLVDRLWDYKRGYYKIEEDTFIGYYIKDGLVFHLDGIDKGTASGWTDLVKGIRFTGSATKMDKCFSFNGTSDYLVGPSNSMKYLVRNGCTIEVCFSQNNTGARQIFGQGVEGAIAIQTVTSRKGISIATCGNTDLFPIYSKSIELNKKYSISANIDNAIINNEELQKGEVYNMTDISNIPRIGARIAISTISGYFGGEIYSIRIYNRKLTKEEMLHNQMIDSIRFGV